MSMRHGYAQQLLILVLTMALVSCGGGPGGAASKAELRDSIHQLLEAYLAALSEAYVSGDTTALEGLAAIKEIDSIESRVIQMAREGRRLRANLESFTIEDVTVWNRNNAYVTTHEVWDLEVLAAGSDTVLSQVQDQINRVMYQLDREDGEWRVLYRAIQE